MGEFWSWIRIHIISWLVPPKAVEVIDIIQILVIAYFVYHLNTVGEEYPGRTRC